MKVALETLAVLMIFGGLGIAFVAAENKLGGNVYFFAALHCLILPYNLTMKLTFVVKDVPRYIDRFFFVIFH